MPPVPVDADVVGTIFPGKTTRVDYRCKNNLVLDGPSMSTCNKGTGQWSELPRCIRPAISVPESTLKVGRSYSFTEIPSTGGLILRKETQITSSSDELPGHFPQIPPVKGPGLPVPTNVKDVAGSALPDIRGKNPSLSSKELDTLISNPLPGSRPRTRFTWEGPDPAIGDMANNLLKNGNKFAVSVNAQVVNRPSLSVVSIIAIQLCAFIYFN